MTTQSHNTTFLHNDCDTQSRTIELCDLFFSPPLCQNQEIINSFTISLPFCTVTHFCCGSNLGNGHWREMPACSRRPTGWQPERILGFISCQIPDDSWQSQWSLIHLFFIFLVARFLQDECFLLAVVFLFYGKVTMSPIEAENAAIKPQETPTWWRVNNEKITCFCISGWNVPLTPWWELQESDPSVDRSGQEWRSYFQNREGHSNLPAQIIY